MGILVTYRRGVVRHGGRVRLAGLRPAVKEALACAGLLATLMYRAQADCLADAVVSLDTTRDYYSTAELRWEELCATVGKNRKNMTGPLLMVANPQGFSRLQPRPYSQ
jgi:hypothetical protein